MEYKFTIGQKLVIKLNSEEIYEGEYISGGKDRIDLCDISEYKTGANLGDAHLSFYRSEISNVHCLGEIENSDSSIEIPPEIKSNAILIPQIEYERLKNLSQEYIYMATIDKRYYDAIDHLNTCENIGVVGLGAHQRLSTIDLMVLTSWDQIYIFDLFLYNQKVFPEEIASILQSPDIKKIVHDSCLLTDTLYYSYKITINNLFDTQLADLKLAKQNKGFIPESVKNIGECLNHYFNFPCNIMDMAMKVNCKKWKERPLSTGTRNLAAQLGSYLIVLKNHMEKLLLKDFYDDVKIFANSTINLPPCEANMRMNSSQISVKLSDSLLSMSLNDSSQDESLKKSGHSSENNFS